MLSGAQRCRVCATRWSNRDYDQNAEARERKRRDHVRREYGKSLEELERLLRMQGERCAICLRHWTECPAPRPSRYEDGFLQHLYVDHDHVTGKVRGLLCHGCNGAIGLFADDPDRADAAAAYLEFHQREATR
ncbi:MAG: endonuclease domain-containing protein [Vulcanimicrobiaceae bacterium]